FRTLSGVLELPFTYNDMLKITIEGIVRQNSECKSNNELGKFWDLVAYLRQNGDIYNEGDYRIVYVNEFSCNTPAVKLQFKEQKRILLLRKSRIFQLYKKEARAVGETSLPEGSLKFYLEKSPEYIGTKNSVRFKNVSKGYFDVVTQKDENGREVTTYKQSVDMAMAFDYDMLSTHYNINLEVSNTTEPDEFGK
ncbi:MAG: DNA primase, partial [Bacteroidaceae bacterium]|nr:DNA primase [Bacteroidaceae bacterium]